MKRFLAVFAAMMLVLGFAASALAIHAEIPSETQAVVAKGTTQITLGGEIRFRGWYIKNSSADYRGAATPADQNSQAWYDARVRLSLQADVSKNTTGFLHLETDDGTATTANGTSSGDGPRWGLNNNKSAAGLKFLEAWILHKGTGLLGIPAGIKVGHMPLALGHKQFFDHTKFGSDAIVVFADPTKDIHIGLLTVQLTEDAEANKTDGAQTGDTTAYVALATYKAGKSANLGINYTLINNGQTTANQKYDFQNLGIHGDGKIGAFGWMFEYDKQFGNSTNTAKFKGSGLLLGASYAINPVTIRAQYASGSGEDSNANTTKEFQTFLGNDVHYTFIYEYTTRGADDGSSRATGISNTTYYRLGLDAKLTKDLSASIDAFDLRMTKANTGGASKKIGREYDVKLTYQIDRGLVYFVTAGILDPGKAWEQNASLGSVSNTNNKQITQAVHGITLSF
jgi:hypothetical protein